MKVEAVHGRDQQDDCTKKEKTVHEMMLDDRIRSANFPFQNWCFTRANFVSTLGNELSRNAPGLRSHNGTKDDANP
jgi:hypothetical protein